MTTNPAGYPDPENPGQTHFEGCWATQGHHNCAVQEVRTIMEVKRELEEEVNGLEIDLEALRDALDDY